MNKVVAFLGVLLLTFSANAVPRHHRRHVPVRPPHMLEWCFEVPMNGVTCVLCEGTRLACEARRQGLPVELHRYVQTTACQSRLRY